MEQPHHILYNLSKYFKIPVTINIHFCIYVSLTIVLSSSKNIYMHWFVPLSIIKFPWCFVMGQCFGSLKLWKKVFAAWFEVQHADCLHQAECFWEYQLKQFNRVQEQGNIKKKKSLTLKTPVLFPFKQIRYFSTEHFSLWVFDFLTVILSESSFSCVFRNWREKEKSWMRLHVGVY